MSGTWWESNTYLLILMELKRTESYRLKKNLPTFLYLPPFGLLDTTVGGQWKALATWAG